MLLRRVTMEKEFLKEGVNRIVNIALGSINIDALSFGQVQATMSSCIPMLLAMHGGGAYVRAVLKQNAAKKNIVLNVLHPFKDTSFESTIKKARDSGQWVYFEHVDHLDAHGMAKLMGLIESTSEKNTVGKYRLFLSCTPENVGNIPIEVVLSSIPFSFEEDYVFAPFPQMRAKIRYSELLLPGWLGRLDVLVPPSKRKLLLIWTIATMCLPTMF